MPRTATKITSCGWKFCGSIKPPVELNDEGVIVLGGSSDHCILDIENCPRKLKPGDIMEFSLSYNNMLYATNRRDIPIKFLHE